MPEAIRKPGWMVALVCWWHRAVLNHEQSDQMNGAAEPGVWCYCDWGWLPPTVPPRPPRFFPSDGGGGR